MVDFTQPINNHDMVNGLNALVHRNIDLSICYGEDLAALLAHREYRDDVQELVSLHERHAHMLGETIRALGGAPDYSGDRHHWVSRSKMLFGKLRHDTGLIEAVRAEEEQLQTLYKKSVQALKASPESVAAINQALDEREAALRWLYQASPGGQA